MSVEHNDTSDVPASKRERMPADVASEAFRRYSGRLIALARTRLDVSVRQKVDPEEIVQSVYKSFFRRQADGIFEFVSWEGVWGLLTRATVWKCRDRTKYYRTAARDVRREESPGPGKDGLASWPPWEDQEPTTEQAAILAETIETLMRRLEVDGREILTLRLQGYTTAEIAAEVGRGERTVERVLARVRKWLMESIEGM